MRTSHTRTRAAILVAAFALSSPALAEGYGRFPPYGAGYGAAGRYGYADGLVSGAYIGAPLTRVPSPTRIVPSPWSYGTYGIPTVTGIPPAPVGQPTVTVINAGGGKAPSRRGGSQTSDEGASDVRVIEVRVPRR